MRKYKVGDMLVRNSFGQFIMIVGVEDVVYCAGVIATKPIKKYTVYLTHKNTSMISYSYGNVWLSGFGFL